MHDQETATLLRIFISGNLQMHHTTHFTFKCASFMLAIEYLLFLPITYWNQKIMVKKKKNCDDYMSSVL